MLKGRETRFSPRIIPDAQRLPVRTLSENDFAWVNWQPKDFGNFPERAISEIKIDYDIIKNIRTKDRTFENTVAALDEAGKNLGQKIHLVKFLAEVSPSTVVRKAAHKMEAEYSKNIVDVVYDEKIYQALKEYAAKKEKLIGDEKILFDDTMRGYRRMGFDLPKAKQKMLKKNLKELSRLSILFRKNLNNYKDHITLAKTETAGLPRRFLKGLRRDSKGRYVVTLEYPDINPFLENSANDLKRKEITDKNSRKGGPENIAILERIVALRRANAELLGYATFAHYAMEERMAKKPETVMNFLKGIEKKIAKGARKDREELIAFKKEFTGNPKAKYEYYDSYYVNQLQKHLYALDNEIVREYFPFEKVKEGVFRIYETLLDVKFEPLPDYRLWHEDAQLFAVKDRRKTIAYFAMDLFPREGKYGHAAAFDLIDGREEDGKYIAPLAALVCNFPKPAQEIPSLLSHSEVETFFHEFGHIMHAVLTKARFASQAGFHVAWDFVEMPSQMLENWAWDREMLKKISSHHKTGERLPDELLDKMLSARKFRISSHYVRQILLSRYDMALHYQNAKGKLQEIYRRMLKKMTGLALPKTQLFPAGFGHIVGGYEAGYYSYVWAESYAHDMFTRFEKEGLLNPKTGRDYRAWILEKGGSMNEMDMLKGFLGRRPNNKAFLKYIGLP
jgi:thimet oligopeptidase